MKEQFREKIDLTDQELINAALDGNNAAFRTLVERYQGQIAATVFGMLGNCPDAEDVGQEVFIRFYNILSKFRHESSVGTYLTRISINLSINQIKRRQRNRQTYDEKLPGSLPGNYGTEDRLQMIQIRRSIMKLKPRYRSVVVLRFMQGYSTQETAEILNTPPGTVMSLLSRALKTLRCDME